MLKNIKEDLEAKNKKMDSVSPEMLHAILKFENLNNFDKNINPDTLSKEVEMLSVNMNDRKRKLRSARRKQSIYN